MKTASSSVTLEQVRKRHKPPSTHAPNSRFSSENVTLGKVEGSIQVRVRFLVDTDCCQVIFEVDCFVILKVSNVNHKCRLYMLR